MRTSKVFGVSVFLQHLTVLVAALGVASIARADDAGTLNLMSDVAPINAVEAVEAMAHRIDSVAGGISSEMTLMALEDAAEAGQPIALWRLGMMYENGEGVVADPARAFGYFSRIANDYANTPPRSLEADIVAQSFVKIGEYYNEGLPDAGIEVDADRSHMLILHAASYFGDADAQYRVGKLYLSDDGFGLNALQSARWLSLSARKGHVAAQATLGDMLFRGETIARQPIEGLMWLTVANDHAYGTLEQNWVGELLNNAMSIATPEERSAALAAADTLGVQFGG